MIIQVDTREQKNAEVIAYFESVGQAYIRKKVNAGDYCDYDNPKVTIDLKKDLEEVVGNVTKDHDRFVREIERATNEMGCKLIVLIRKPLPNLQAVKTYKVRRYSENHPNRRLRGKPVTRMSMDTLYKIMVTMQEKYNIEWRFCSRKDSGRLIIEIIKESKKGECNEQIET